MRHRLNKTRAASFTAAAVMAAASVAQAGLVLDLRLAGGATASTITAGSTVSVNVIATISGANPQLQDAFFSVLNSGTIGNLTPVTLTAPFNGVATDVTPNVTTSFSGTPFGPAGSVDIGSTNDASADGWVFARSTSMQTITAGQVIGTLSFQATGSGATTLTIDPRSAGTSTLIVPALWREDGVVKDATGATAAEYTAGAGVTITVGGGGVAGDVNGDGVVNLGDINYVTARWLNAGPAGDANNDGVVNLGDINYITARWLNTSEPGGVSVAALAAVPEPASIGLVGVGVAGLLARRRK